MTEKILTNKKHGMAMLIFFLLLMAAAIVMVVIGAMRNIIALILPGIVILCFIWIPMMGLKILKPQEALVLTLFGHYYGTLKGEGYYYVNPFCTGVNPAAKTRLSQSGDVKTLGVKATTGDNTTSIEVDTTGKKLSLKIMTLSNNRQKINDCLGNPVEIGIAVTWRIIDTAKAVFNVDNYKEYLSLQCDSALRNIVRLYPYDVAPNVDTTGDGVADVAQQHVGHIARHSLTNDHAHDDQRINVLRHRVGGNHPAALLQFSLQIVQSPFGVLCIFGFHVPDEQRVHHVVAVIDERFHLADLLVCIAGDLHAVGLHLFVAFETQTDELIVLSEDLCRRAREVQADLRDVGSQVVHAECHFVGQVFFVFPYDPAQARINQTELMS